MQCILVLSIIAVLAGSALAQSTTDGAIGGTLYDASDAVVLNATVTVNNNGINAEQTVTTDASGYYHVTELQPIFARVPGEHAVAKLLRRGMREDRGGRPRAARGARIRRGTPAGRIEFPGPKGLAVV
jgi:hypothetical protein